MTGRTVHIGIVGIGNCASSLVRGLTNYRDVYGNEPVPGLMHVKQGGCHVSDTIFGGVPLNAELQREVWDSP